MTHRRGTTTSRRAGVLLAGLCACLAPKAAAQPTNLEAYQALAVGCLAEVPDTAQALRLDAPPLMPYLRTALVQRWQQEGRVLFVPDTTGSAPVPPPPRLRYEIEAAQVAYEPAAGKRLTRTVSLAMRYVFIGSDGRLLREDRCTDAFTDTIPRADRLALETEAFPETQGAAPPGSWRRRYLEPVVLAAATAVAVFLFFNLRSERSGGGL